MVLGKGGGSRLAPLVDAAVRMGGPMTEVVTRGLEWTYQQSVGGMPGLGGAEEMASEYRGRHASAEAAIDALIAWQAGKAGIAGFVTGLGGAITLPIGLPAHLFGTAYIQLRLVAAIAHLRGYDINSDHVRMVALGCLAGVTAADRLKDAGVGLGALLGRQAVSRLPSEVAKNLNVVVGPLLARHAGARGASHAARLLPLVGGVVAGGFDVAATRLIGRAAKRLFVVQDERPGEPG